jgi:uncharacterized protein (TIGR00369 family)
MDEDDKSVRVADGEWAGWRVWRGMDPFEDLTGPFYSREQPDGTVRCAFRAERKHMNGGGFMHGGCLMTFADYALFAIAHNHRTTHAELEHVGGVTATLQGEFVSSVEEGALVEATGEVVKAGRSLVFVRGLVTSAEKPLLAFSGVIKRVKRRRA